MPITVIPNQPINLNPYVGDECLTADDKVYTPLYNTGDTLYVQMINESCAGELFCNPNFTPSQGTTISVTNPNFVGSLTGWSIGVGSPAWSWDASGGALLTYSTGSSLDKSIQQVLTGLIAGMSYTITFTIRSNTSTTGLAISVILGGTTSSTTYTTNGTYSIEIIAGLSSGITFIQDGGTDGTLILDTIEIIGLTDCFEAIGTDWSITSSGATKVAGTASNIAFLATSASPDIPYFKVNFIVIGQSSGTLTVTIGGFPIATVTANGEYTGYNITAIGGDSLIFAADALFDGTISYISVEELQRDYAFNIYDQAGSSVQDLVADSKVTYIDDRIIISVDLDGVDTSIGCLYIVAGDPCTSTTLSSNIFEVNTEHPCAKLMVGYGESETVSLGFLWNSFLLSHRVRFLSFNPEYPIEGDDYEFSNGTRSITFAKREKYYTGLIDYVDETIHDTISAQILTSNFTIDGVSYFVKQEGYKPLWNSQGQQKLAQANIALRKVSGTLYSK